MVDRIVRTCLAKDPDDRWQTARDLLPRARVGCRGGRRCVDNDFARRAAQIDSRCMEPGGHRRHCRTACGSGVSDTAASRAGSASCAVRSVDAGHKRSDVLRALGRWAPSGLRGNIRWRIQALGKPIDQITAQTFAGTEGASYPFWAPDGRSIAFFADGKLKRLNVDGGLPQVITDAPTGRGGTWSRDNVIVFSPTTASTLMSVAANGGTPVPVTRFTTGENSHRWPQFLPDGRRFLFLSTQGVQGTHGVFVGRLDTGEVTRLLEDDSPGIYVPPRTLLVVRQGTLIALSFDPVRGTVSGQPLPVVQPIGFDSLLSRGAFTVSETGVLAHRSGIAERRQLVWADRSGTVIGTVGPRTTRRWPHPN